MRDPAFRVEWCVLFEDGYRMSLSEFHAAEVHAHARSVGRDARLCRRLVTEWEETNQSKET